MRQRRAMLRLLCSVCGGPADVTDDGVLVISAQRFRTQERNREDARERLAAFIESGRLAPKPRVATKPTRASKARRLDAKRERSTIKRGRSVRDWD